jgi:hypothetical protein
MAGDEGRLSGEAERDLEGDFTGEGVRLTGDGMRRLRGSNGERGVCGSSSKTGIIDLPLTVRPVRSPPQGMLRTDASEGSMGGFKSVGQAGSELECEWRGFVRFVGELERPRVELESPS